MKVLAPIRAHDELEMLARERRRGTVLRHHAARVERALQRPGVAQPAQSQRLELRNLGRDETPGGWRARVHVPVFITLNAPYYSADQIPLVIELARRLSEEIGVDALIVTDINLLAAARRSASGAAICTSAPWRRR